MGNNLLSIFWAKSFSEKWMLIRIGFLLAFFRFCLIVLPFKRLARFLGEQHKESPDIWPAAEECYIENISRFITNMSNIVPWDAKCLVQAAAGKRLMNHNRIQSTIYFGVKKNDEGTLEAHAWLRVGNKIILGGENAHEFVVVSSYS